MRPSYFHLISGSRFANSLITRKFENIKHSGITFDTIGMDAKTLTLEGVKKYINDTITDQLQDHVFFIQGHGCAQNNSHYIELSNTETVPTSELLKAISAKLNRPAHIILSSCYSGLADASVLKRYSTILTTTTAHQTGLVEDSADLLTSFAVLYRFGLTTEQIMLLMIPAYLTDHALTNTSNPVLYINRGHAVYNINTSIWRMHLPQYEFANRSALFRALTNNYNYNSTHYSLALNNYFANPIITKFYIALDAAAAAPDTSIATNISLLHSLCSYKTTAFDTSIPIHTLLSSSLNNSYIGALLLNTTYTTSLKIINNLVKPVYDRPTHPTISQDNIFTVCLRHLCKVINFRFSYFHELFEFANSFNAQTGLCKLVDLYNDKINQIEIEKTPLLIWLLHKKNYAHVTQLLGFKAVNPNVIDYSGSNILHYCEDLDLFKAALVHGVNPHHRNTAGLTAVEIVKNTDRKHFLDDISIKQLIQQNVASSQGNEKKQKITPANRNDFDHILFEPQPFNLKLPQLERL